MHSHKEINPTARRKPSCHFWTHSDTFISPDHFVVGSQSKIKILRSNPADQAARRGHRLWQKSEILIKPCCLHEAFIPPHKPENSSPHTGQYRLIQVCEAFPEFCSAYRPDTGLSKSFSRNPR